MPSPPDSHGSEHRRLRRGTGWDEGLIDAIVFYGLGQVLLLSWLMLWYVFQSPFRRGDAVLGTIVGLTCLPLAIGLRRRGVLSIAAEWPKLDDVTLGIGDGYRQYLARAVFLSAILGLCAYGSATVGTFTTATLAPAAVALVIVAGGVALYPTISGTDRRSRWGRFGLYATALLGGFYFGAPFAAGVGFHSAAISYVVLVLLGLWDAIR